MSPQTLILILLGGLAICYIFLTYRLNKLADKLRIEKEKAIDEDLKHKSFSDLVNDANKLNNDTSPSNGS